LLKNKGESTKVVRFSFVDISIGMVILQHADYRKYVAAAVAAGSKM